MGALEDRLAAKCAGAHEKVAELNKRIRKLVKQDREIWLTDLAGSGDWSKLKQLRKGQQKCQGRLRDVSGTVVSSEERAEEFAEYLETVQWAVRSSAQIVNRPVLRAPIGVDTGMFNEKELTCVLKRLRAEKASGEDSVAPEFFKALLSDTEALREVLGFCNLCWRTKQVPTSWHAARVRMIFKKGDPAERGNYRPISVLNLGYKVFAALLLHRLKCGGVERFICPTQFGFKAGMGTADALFILRRLLERTWNSKTDGLVLLALDWAKAFDAISPDGLKNALRRFGLPQAFLEMIDAIYSSRSFFVSECGATSSQHPQHYGISQGCPLSPYLFVVLMSVLMTDAQEKLKRDHGIDLPKDSVSELLYADDTLLVGTCAGPMQKYLDCIVDIGAEYGLCLNWKKVELMSAGVAADIAGPDGKRLEPKISIVYLGSSVAMDGHIESELARRIGMAQAELVALQKVWRHTSLSKAEKYDIYRAVVISRLMYGLQVAWLGKASLRKLDGFNARCLRKMMGIPPAYHSRVSNKAVLDRMGARSLSKLLLEQQLGYLGTLARRPPECPARSGIFDAGLILKADFKRRVGRPRMEWAPELLKILQDRLPPTSDFRALTSEAPAWRQFIRQLCR